MARFFSRAFDRNFCRAVSRIVYRCLLGLHPPAFQREFADEMLWIFDQVAKKQSMLPLFADGVVSVARQWLVRGVIPEAVRKLLFGEIAPVPAAGATAGPFAWEHIDVPERPLPIWRMIQGSGITLLFLATLSVGAFRPEMNRPTRDRSITSDSGEVQGAAGGRREQTSGAYGETNSSADRATVNARTRAADEGEFYGEPQGNGAGAPAAASANAAKLGQGETQAVAGSQAQTAQGQAAPAERQFRAWLDAFNSGDRVRLQAFDEKNYPEEVKEVDGLMRFRKMTGGFDVKRVEEAGPTKFSAIVKERESDQFAHVEIEVAAAEPHRITKMDLNAIGTPAEFAQPRMSEEQAIGALRTEVERQVAADHFAGTVMITKNGKTVFSGAYGLADREKKINNELNTQFRIGSMNKMFTAVAVLQLAQSGKIKLTAPVGEYLTDYPNKNLATKVTIHHLLTHTGGTGDFFGPEFDAHRLELRTLQDYVKLYGKRDLQFEPGSKWEYSNYGFLLLGLVVEKASGQNYYDYVREHVYAPAGMTSTDSLPEDQTMPRRSVGYTKVGGSETWKPNTDTLPYRGTSAGGGYSTVEDLQRFAEALKNHKLLDAHYTELLTTGKMETGGGDKYAYGFMDRTSGGVRSFGHGGGAPGMNGELTIYPESGYVVAVLANLDPPAAGRVASFIGNRLPAK